MLIMVIIFPFKNWHKLALLNRFLLHIYFVKNTISQQVAGILKINNIQDICLYNVSRCAVKFSNRKLK